MIKFFCGQRTFPPHMQCHFRDKLPNQLNRGMTVQPIAEWSCEIASDNSDKKCKSVKPLVRESSIQQALTGNALPRMDMGIGWSEALSRRKLRTLPKPRTYSWNTVHNCVEARLESKSALSLNPLPRDYLNTHPQALSTYAWCGCQTHVNKAFRDTRDKPSCFLTLT